MSKVIHVGDETHRRFKAWCTDRGIEMKDAVDDLIRDAVDGPRPNKAVPRWPNLDAVERRARRM